MPRLRLPLCARMLGALAAAAAFLPFPAAAQHRAELEVERDEDALTSRVEFYGIGLPWIRLERKDSGGESAHRAGIQLPGKLIGLDGFASLFVHAQPDRTARGASFELGRGVPMLGGSIERGVQAFSGLYVKLRSTNAELGLGGGKRDADWLQHGGLYVKGVRWSAAIGGARGPNQIDFQHFAASWHPAQRGGGPGARFTAERRNGRRYVAELLVADRTTFSHFSVWGQYGMDQWPHRKTFEAVGDMMRYVRPPIMNHGYTLGRGVVGGQWEVNGDQRELTLDGRFFPVRFLRERPAPGAAASPLAAGSYLSERVLPSVMIGGFREMSSGTSALLGEIAFPPFSIYGEAPLTDRGSAYLFAQYRVAMPF